MLRLIVTLQTIVMRLSAICQILSAVNYQDKSAAAMPSQETVTGGRQWIQNQLQIHFIHSAKSFAKAALTQPSAFSGSGLR